MKRKSVVLFIILASCILLPGLIYLGLAIYYQDSFYYGTWINGIYCTGKRIEEVQQELTNNFTYEGVTILGKESRDFLSAEEAGLTYDFRPALQEYLKEQDTFDWLIQLITGHRDQQIMPVIQFEEEKLKRWLYTTEFYTRNRQVGKDHLTIISTKDGYQLKEDKKDILDLVMAEEKIAQALLTAREELFLQEEGCYFQRPEDDTMANLRQLYHKVEEFQNRSITYTIKDKIRVLTSGELAQLLTYNTATGEFLFQPDGEFQLNQQAIEELIKKLADEYDTWHNFWFTTHDGRRLLLTKGNYGLQIDQKQEIRFLRKCLQQWEGTAVSRTPQYSRDVTYNGQHGIGSTYIEIDLKKQKLYYIDKGELRLETSVVTGCMNQGMSTPEMVCYIYNKTEDTVLRGENYRSPVEYWMPVYGGIGIHDAGWRNEFGEDIYLKDGSHGCINTPLEKVAELYHMVEVGVPVVIHN